MPKALKEIITVVICFAVGFFIFDYLDTCNSSNPPPSSTVSVSTHVITTSPTYTLSTTSTASSLDVVVPTPTYESLLSAPQFPSQDSIITDNYSRSYGLDKWTWELHIHQSLYDYYKLLPRIPTTNYSVYVTHPLDDDYMHSLVEKIRDAAEKKGYSEFDTVSMAAAFVQSLEYTNDTDTTGFDEYPRFPIETLVDNGGDCEDTAILTASLIDSMGYGVVLLRLSNESGTIKHMAVGVKGSDNVTGTYWKYQGGKYYYLETTGEGWRIGQLPDTYKKWTAQVFPMMPIPILTHSWETKANGRYLELRVKVENMGSAIAENVYVYAGFDAGSDRC
jgi:hypothetical protein